MLTCCLCLGSCKLQLSGAHGAQRKTMSTQCLGKSKKTGVRCGKKTNNNNGYCTTHQDQAAAGSSEVGEPSDAAKGQKSQTPVVCLPPAPDTASKSSANSDLVETAMFSTLQLDRRRPYSNVIMIASVHPHVCLLAVYVSALASCSSAEPTVPSGKQCPRSVWGRARKLACGVGRRRTTTMAIVPPIKIKLLPEVAKSGNPPMPPRVKSHRRLWYVCHRPRTLLQSQVPTMTSQRQQCFQSNMMTVAGGIPI